MTTLLLLLSLAADPIDARVFIEINEARLAESIPAVAHSLILEDTAAVMADWLGYANRRNKTFVFHNVNTAWALKEYPDLKWDRLRATFPDGLPDQLSAHSVARLCGWEGGLVYDIEGEARRCNAFDLVYGWAHSDETSPPTNHWMVLLNFIANFNVCGVASEPRGGGRQIVVAVFGEVK